MRQASWRLLTLTTVVLLAYTSSAAAAPNDRGGGWKVRDGDVTVEFTPTAEDSMGEISIQDASGCNGDVCIYLTGSGLVVDRWRTTAYVTSAKCTAASFWANGVRVRSSSTYCTSGGGTISATWNNPGQFADGTQACNSWSGVSGYPCKTIQV